MIHKIEETHKEKKKYVELYKRYIKSNNLDNIKSYKSNMVTETLINVCNYLEKL